MNTLITILTPSYNRAKLLFNLYRSLLQQTNQNFKWLIIDDGSSDNTKEILKKFEQHNFDIKYIYKDNGGKHTALNLGFDAIDTELTFIVDSDDILTEDAIETIIEDWNKVKEESVCGISYLRGYSKDKVIGKNFSKDFYRSNFIEERFNKNCKGDKAEVWRTDLLKKNKFPVFDNEKFLSESVCWINISHCYDMYFINKIIYITEYLENGLTKSGRSLRIKCPKGGMLSSQMTLDKRFSFKQRIKGGLLYIIYSRFDNVNYVDCIKNIDNHMIIFFLYPLACLFYFRWKKLIDN